jgi:hypothetical protein
MKMKNLLTFLFTVVLLSLLGSGAYAQWGKTVMVSTDKELNQAMANPDVQNVTLSDGYYSTIDHKVTFGETIAKNKPSPAKGPAANWVCAEGYFTFPDMCFPGYDYELQLTAYAQPVYVGPPPTPSPTPPGVCPTSNNFHWSLYWSSGVINPTTAPVFTNDDANTLHEDVTNLQPGYDYIFRFTFDDGSYVQTAVFHVWINPAIGIDAAQATCSDVPLTLDSDVEQGYPVTGELSYTWDAAIPANLAYLSSTTSGAPTFSGAPAGTYTYTLTVSEFVPASGSGINEIPAHTCTATKEVTVTVHDIPHVSPFTNVTIGDCSGQHVDLNPTVTGSTSVLWTGDTQYLEYATNVIPNVFSGADPGEYHLTLTATNTVTGCDSARSITITVDDPPVADVFAEDDNIGACEGQFTILDYSGSSGAGATYTFWSSNDPGLQHIEQDPDTKTAYFSGPVGTWVYVLTVEDKYGCTATDNVTVTVDPLPTAIAGPGTTIGECALQQYLLDPEYSGTPDLHFSWSPIDYLDDATLAAPTFSGAPDGTYTLTFTVTDHYGCTATDDVTIVVDPLPTVNAGNGGSIGECAGQEFQLDPSFSGTDLHFSWAPNTYLDHPEHAAPIFSGAPDGSYELTLTVTDGYGCTASDNVTIVVDPLPFADAGPGKTIGECAGQQYQLDPVFLGTQLSYSWAPNTYLDHPEQAGPIFSGAPHGTYTLTVTVTDLYHCTATDNVTIVVDPLPTASIASNGHIGSCDGQEFDILGSTSGTDITILWTGLHTEYLSDTDIEDPTFEGAPEGTYTYVLTVTDTYECTATASVTIVVDRLPDANAGGDKHIGSCAQQTATLNGEADGDGISYVWSGNGSEFLSATDVLDPVFYGDEAGAGVYTLLLTVTDDNGCVATDDVTITVEAVPTVDAGDGGYIGSCMGQQFALDATATGYNHTVLWTGNGYLYLNDPEAEDPTFSGAPAGTYTLTITVTDEFECTDSDQVTIVVDPLPTASVTPATSPIGACDGQTYQIAATTSGTGIEWAWTGNGAAYLDHTNIEDPIFDGHASGPGTYTMTLTVTDDYSCIATATLTITVEDLPDAYAGLDGQIGACNGQTFSLAGAESSGYNETWAWTGTGADFLSATDILNPVFNGNSAGPGTWTLILTVTDAFGCEASDDMTVTVDPLPTANAGADHTMGQCQTYEILNSAATGTETLLFNWHVTGPPAKAPNWLNSYTTLHPTFDPTIAGTYTLTLTVTDHYGCTATDQMVITVVPNPTADAGNGTTLGQCAKTYVFDGSATGDVDVLWTPSTYLDDPTSLTPTFTSSDAGTFTYTLTVEDEYGCSATSSLTMIVDPLPDAQAPADIDQCDYAQYSVELVGEGGGTAPLAYSWSPNTHLLNSDESTATFVGADPGIYPIVLTVTDKYGCTATDDVTVTIHALPEISCPSNQIVCAMAEPFDLATELNEDPTGGVFTYLGDAITNFDPVEMGVGVHTLTYTVTDAVTECTNTCSFTITVDAMPASTLEGQVKYWNEVETYMPTPYPVCTPDCVPCAPYDYFYVALYSGETQINTADPLANALDWQKVDISLQEDELGNITELMSYFKFDYQLQPNTNYFVTVWDGSALWEEYQTYTTTTGAVYDWELGKNFTWNNWGGVTAVDALAMQLMINHAHNMSVEYGWTWIGEPLYTLPTDLNYGYYSNSIANVNSSLNGITALDALTTQYRIAGLLPVFPSNTPNFRVAGRFIDELPKMTWSEPFTNHNLPIDVQFTKSTYNYLYHTPAISQFYKSNTFNTQPFFLSQNNTSPFGECPDYGYINLYYEAVGDVNASYIPLSDGFKASAPVLQYENEIAAVKGDIVDIPVTLDRTVELGAMSLGMTFRKDLIQVLDVPGFEVVNIDNELGTVRVVWTDQNGRKINAGDAMVTIKALVLNDISVDTRLFELEAMTEVGTPSAQPISDITYKTVALGTKPGGSSDLMVNNYPNPFNTTTHVTYTLPESGQVKLVVYNKLGAVVKNVLNENQSAGVHTMDFNRADLAPGVYYYRLTLQGTTTFTATRTMVITE